MADFAWFGGFGRYFAPGNWTPAGLPGAGDTAILTTGTATIVQHSVAATVLLDGTAASSQPVLYLHDASLAAVTMPTALPQPPYGTVTASPPAYGLIDVTGLVNIGSIDLGAYADMSRAPPPYGHAALTAPDHLTVDLGPASTLDAGFDVQWGSTLTVSGAGLSVFAATTGTLDGGNAVIHATLGSGTILMTNGPVDYDGYAQTGSLELGGSVASGATIDINMGQLQIDHPLHFQGTLDLFAPEHDPYPYNEIGAQSVTLRGLSATSYSFDDATHTLQLYSGKSVIDQTHFTPDITTASFGNSYASAIQVVQVSGGVLLSGLYSGVPLGATPIPMNSGSS